MLTNVPGGTAAQSLMTPYLSFLLSPFVEQLQGSDDREEGSFGPTELCVVQTLTKSMNVDDGGPYNRPIIAQSSDDHLICPLETAFWRDDRLQQVMPVLIALIAPAGADQDAPSPSGTGTGGGREAVSACLVALGETATDDALLKRLNLDVLMHTRADDALVRIFALQCARALWTAHGSKLVGAWASPPNDEYLEYLLTAVPTFFCHQLGFVLETVTFIVECAEDEHDGVVSETHVLKAAVEGVTGERITGA